MQSSILCQFLIATAIISSVPILSVRATDTMEEIPLWPKTAPETDLAEKELLAIDRRKTDRPWRFIRGIQTARICAALPEPDHRNGSSVVICPGGGYSGLAIDHEGHDVARWFLERGIAPFVLKYRCGSEAFRHPIPLGDVQRAIRLVRNRARQWHLDPKRIGVMGFSAGGHLASTAGVLFDSGDPSSHDPIERESSRPDYMVLIYSVCALQHAGSRANLLGPSPDTELVDRLTSPLQVTAETPPAFLLHTSEDRAVSDEESIRMYRALRNHGVPAELHLFQQGAHGFGMIEKGLPVDDWPRLLERWLGALNLLKSFVQ